VSDNAPKRRVSDLLGGAWERSKKSLRKFGRAVRLAAQRFLHDHCTIRAAALSYSTLLALVPVGVVSLIILNSFGSLSERGRSLRQLISQQVFPRGAGPGVEQFETAIDRIFQSLTSQISETSVPVTALSVGAFILTILFLFAGVEKTFDDLWRVKARRRTTARLRNFWTIMTLGPVMVFFSYYIALELGGKLPETLGFLRTVITTAFPYAFSVMAFYLVYQFAPNTSVRFSSAFTGAIFAGLLWEILKRPLSYYLTSVLTFRQVYGPIGLIPLFLIWLYVTWLIVLFGAELCYCLQHLRLMAPMKKGEGALSGYRGYYGVRVALTVARHFETGAVPVPARAMAKRLGLPRPFVWELAEKLAEARIITRVESPRVSYTLTRPPEKITLSQILTAVSGGLLPAPEAGDEASVRIAALFEAARSSANEVLDSPLSALLRTTGSTQAWRA